jgi:hypothetical protein
LKLPKSPSLEFEHGGQWGIFEAGKPFGCYLAFSNNGESRARVSRLTWNAAIYPESKIDAAINAGTLTLPNWVEPIPEERDIASLDQFSLRVAFSPSPEMVKNVLAGWKVFYYGRIEYADEEGAQFATNFCVKYDGNYAFRAHSPFNDSGPLEERPLEELKEKTEPRGVAFFRGRGVQEVPKDAGRQSGAPARDSDF